MEKRLMTMLVGLFLLVGGVLAQTKVSGTVVSQDDGQPVVGATVLVVGTSTGAVTNASGQFSLTVPAGKKTLRITYIGMEPLEVSARPNMRILLTSNNKALDEARKHDLKPRSSYIYLEDLNARQYAELYSSVKLPQKYLDHLSE